MKLVFIKQVHRLRFYNRDRGDHALKRNYKQIERDQIAIHRSKGLSFSAIGEMLGRIGSTYPESIKETFGQ